jgi:hypothetical protein
MQSAADRGEGTTQKRPTGFCAR